MFRFFPARNPTESSGSMEALFILSKTSACFVESGALGHYFIVSYVHIALHIYAHMTRLYTFAGTRIMYLVLMQLPMYFCIYVFVYLCIIFTYMHMWRSLSQ